MQKKMLIIIALALITTILFFINLSSRDSVKTIKHGYFPVQSNETTMTNYKPLQFDIEDYNITLAVPDTTENYVGSDKGNEMRFSTYLVNSDLAFRGYMQIWRIKDLERFLSYSKSLSPFDFRSYKVNNVEKREYHGFLIEWTAEFGEGLISGKEYWLSINNTEEVIRLSILTDTAFFPNKLQGVIQQILDSLQIDIKSII